METETQSRALAEFRKRDAERIAAAKKDARITKLQRNYMVKLWQATSGDGHKFEFDKTYHYYVLGTQEIKQIRTIHSTLALYEAFGTVTYRHYPDGNCSREPEIAVPTMHLFETVASAAGFGQHIMRSAITHKIESIRQAIKGTIYTMDAITKEIDRLDKFITK